MADSAYCVKCGQARSVTGAKRVTTANGRPALTGKCGTCGTKMYKFLPGGTSVGRKPGAVKKRRVVARKPVARKAPVRRTTAVRRAPARRTTARR